MRRSYVVKRVFLIVAACGSPPRTELANHRVPEPIRDPFRSFFAGRKDIPSIGPCDDTAYERARKHGTAEAWANLPCTIGEDAAGLAATRDFAAALLAEGFPHDCVGLLSPLTTPYTGGLQSRGLAADEQAVADEILDLGGRCLAADDKAMAVFVAPRCPGEACYAFGPGSGPVGEACAAITGPTGAMSAPEGPLVDVSFCCGLDQLGVFDHDGHRYLYIHSSEQFVRVCGGGTASATPEAVYRIDQGKLVLEVERTILWH
jgi:hypothetical protein